MVKSTQGMRVYKSAQEDIELPPLDLLTFLFESSYCAAEEDTKIHVEAADANNFVTKAEARDIVKRISYLLRHRFGIGASGAGRDVIVSTCSGNPFIPVLVYSIIAAGGVYSGAPTGFTVTELVRQVQDADAKILLCSPECLETTVAAAKQCCIPLDHVLTIDCKRPRDWQLILVNDQSRILDLKSGPMLEWSRMTSLVEQERTTACLLYSSGTTGLPKGVRISHRNLIASTVCGMQLAKKYMKEQDAHESPFIFSKIAHLPMAHIGGVTWSSLYPFCWGGTAFWVEKYDFKSFIKYHRQYRLTTLWTVPPIWLSIANSLEVTDHFDTVRIAITGAAPMGPELTGRAARRLGKGTVSSLNSLWGATETTGSMTGVDWDLNDETCSVGLPFPNMKIRLVDAELNDVEPGQPGEMLVSGPVVCQGYHNRPDADLNSFIHGFYRTGDVAIFKDGFLHIVDRLKELIKYKGLQVAPAELEALLLSHPKIDDAAVIGVQDDSQATEVPRAFIVAQPNTQLSAQEVIDFVQSNLASHKRLRGGVVFVDEIPKSASGKILRKILRQRVVEDGGKLQSRL